MSAGLGQSDLDEIEVEAKRLKCPRGIVTAAAPYPATRVEVPGAIICGPLAAHRNTFGRGYAVTHVPSGLSILRGVRTLALARGAMGVLLKAGDWSLPAERLIPEQSDLRARILHIRRLVERTAGGTR